MTTCSLSLPRVKETLARLFQEAEEKDPAVFAQVRAAAAQRGGDARDSQYAALLGGALMPVDERAGRLLYILARSRACRLLVEFGCSLGVSTIYLAAAARDGGGRVITTEQDAGKVRRARENLAAAGLAEHVEVREGDARETLRTLAAPDAKQDAKIDLLFLDGWKDLYLPLLQQLEPALRPGALVVADDLALFPQVLMPYLAHVRDPARGYTSIEIPIGDAMEVSVRSPVA